MAPSIMFVPKLYKIETFPFGKIVRTWEAKLIKYHKMFFSKKIIL